MKIVQRFQEGLAWISSVLISPVIDKVSNFVKNIFPLFCKNKSNTNLTGRVSVAEVKKELIADANEISQLAIVPYGFFKQPKGLNFGSSEGLESNKNLKMATKLEAVEKVTGNPNGSKKPKKPKFTKAPELNWTKTSHPNSAARQFRGKV